MSEKLLIVVVLLSIASVSSRSDGRRGASGPTYTSNLDCSQFLCPISQNCIPYEFVCDGTIHCTNGTTIDRYDENHCQCSGGNDEFECASGLCIASFMRCDGVKDCHDESDEANCPGEAEPTYTFDCTTSGQWLCPISKNCIPYGYVCNGIIECTIGTTIDRSDENHCQCSGGNDEFKCASSESGFETYGLCIDANMRCDGVKDCPDGSDEANCPSG